MADSKVSALTAVVTPATTDEIPVNQGGVSKKLTSEQLKELALTSSTTGLNTTATNVKGAINELVPSKGTQSESNTIDCSNGQIIGMTLTQARTLSFSNLPGGQSRTVVLTGDYAIDFNASYSLHFQNTISQRTGDVKIFTVFNYGTTGSPLYGIKDTLGGLEAIPVPITVYGSDATTGVKLRFPMPFAFYITDIKAAVSVAPSGSTLIVDVNKDTTTILSTKLSIDAGETTSSTAATPLQFASELLRSFAAEDVVQIDIDQVGSSTAGQGLCLTIYGYRLGV